MIERLKKEKIDLIISSDVLRCYLTTKEIIKHIKIPVIYSEFREKDNGDLIGKKHKEIDRSSLKGDFKTKNAPNGENLQEVRERGRNFFRELLKKHKNKSILIVSHSTFLKVFIGDLLGMLLYDSIFRLRIDYCSISEVEIEDRDNYKITKLNNQDFLMS